MQYLYIEIKIVNGEYTHYYRGLHSTNCKNAFFAVQWFISHFYGYGTRVDNSDTWYFHNGEVCCTLSKFKILFLRQYKYLNKVIYH